MNTNRDSFENWWQDRVGVDFEPDEKGHVRSAWQAGESAERERIRKKLTARLQADISPPLVKEGHLWAIEEMLAFLDEQEKDNGNA